MRNGMMWLCAVALVGGCAVEEAEETSTTQQTGQQMFQQTWNGGAAFGHAMDPNTGAHGWVHAFENGTGPSRTAFLNFFYQGPDPASRQCFTWFDPWWGSHTWCYYTRFITKSGWGQIPAEDFTVDGRAAEARLRTTTGAGFHTETCVFEWSPWFYGNCTYGEPASFDLLWKPDGYASFSRNGTREQTIGGWTWRRSGSLVSKSAQVAGTALGFTIVNAFGQIEDTRGASVTNEIVPMPPMPMP